MVDYCRHDNGRRSGINARLQNYIHSIFGHDVHVLECLFHITEILLSRVIKNIEGSSFSRDTMQPDFVYNMIKNIGKPDMSNFDPRKHNISITGTAKLHMKNLILWSVENEKDPLSGMWHCALKYHDSFDLRLYCLYRFAR